MSTKTRGFANPNHPMHKPTSGIPAAGNTADKPPSGLPAMGPGWGGPSKRQQRAAKAMGSDLAEPALLPKPDVIGPYSPIHIVNPHLHDAPRGKLGRALTRAEYERQAQEHVSETIDTWIAAMRYAPEWGVRVMAAEKLREASYGKANQPISVSTDDMTPAERDARIEFLLARRREREALAAAGITSATDALPPSAPTIDMEGRVVDATKPNGQAT
jgi:hypothetical protein